MALSLISGLAALLLADARIRSALFTGFGFFSESYVIEVLLKFLIIDAIWTPIHLLWLWAGVTVDKLDQS